MTKSERLKVLLECGYFPRELPPPFETITFARYRKSIGQSWGQQQYKKSIPESFSHPRANKRRRTSSIVNPVSQFYVSKLISDEWAPISKYLTQDTYSAEIPEILTNNERAVPPPDFALIGLKTIEIAAGFDFTLKTDISRFYGTIYTHAIAWALHGKAWSKINLNTPIFNASLGNKLDVAVRKGQDNQTIGIPIGPDTSRIISEIIAVAIDRIVKKQLKLQSEHAFRNVDDWVIGFDALGLAEAAIPILANASKEFELELNAEKTKIESSGDFTTAIWPSELRDHYFGLNSSAQAKALERYISKAFDLAARFRTDNVLDFALKRSKGVAINRENWRAYENFLLTAARSNLSTLPAVVQILVSYNHSGYSLDKSRIGKLIVDLINRNAPLGSHSEIAWALFLAKALKISLPAPALKPICELESSVCALLSLDLLDRGLIDGQLDTTFWNTFMTLNSLHSNMWLLSYEAHIKGWLGPASTHVDEDTHFSELKKRNVYFYNLKNNIVHIRREKPKPISPTFRQMMSHRSDAFMHFMQTFQSSQEY